MNSNRLKSVINNMSAMDEKIYNCVPIQDAWTVSMVCIEYKRLHNILPNYAGVEKTLKDMAEQGILRKTHEDKQAVFNRYVNRATEPKKEEVMSIQPKPAKKSLQERMYDCAAKLNTLSEEMASLAHEVEALINAPNPEMEKLQKMKELFKSLAD